MRHLAPVALAPPRNCHSVRGLFLKCVHEQADLVDPVQIVAASGEEQQKDGLHCRSWQRAAAATVAHPPPCRRQRPMRQARQPEQAAVVMNLAPAAYWPTEISSFDFCETLGAVPCRPAAPLAPTACSTRAAAVRCCFCSLHCSESCPVPPLCTKLRVSNRGCLCCCFDHCSYMHHPGST